MVSLHLKTPQTFLNEFSVATEYWTETDIANGLNALTICIEVRLGYSKFFFTVLTTF